MNNGNFSQIKGPLLLCRKKKSFIGNKWNDLPIMIKIWLIYIFLEVSVIGDSFGTADDV